MHVSINGPTISSKEESETIDRTVKQWKQVPRRKLLKVQSATARHVKSVTTWHAQVKQNFLLIIKVCKVFPYKQGVNLLQLATRSLLTHLVGTRLIHYRIFLVFRVVQTGNEGNVVDVHCDEEDVRENVLKTLNSIPSPH